MQAMAEQLQCSCKTRPELADGHYTNVYDKAVGHVANTLHTVLLNHAVNATSEEELSAAKERALSQCQEAALTRRIAWRRSGGGVGFGPSGKQLHPATPELTAWREGPADSSQ